MFLAPCSYFAEAHHCYDGILISCMGSCQTAIAFFQTKYIVVAAGLLENFDLLTDILESGENLDKS